MSTLNKEREFLHWLRGFLVNKRKLNKDDVIEIRKELEFLLSEQGSDFSYLEYPCPGDFISTRVGGTSG